MEREISSGAMLGIVLLALAAVIGLGFGVFAIAKGIANEGTVGVQDSLGTVSTQIFLDYDQKVVTGTQVVGAIKQFEGKPYAVLVATKAFMGNQLVDSAHATGYMVGTATVAGSTWTATAAPNGVDFINYNAVLGQNASGALPTAFATVGAGKGRGSAAAGTTSNTFVSMQNGTYITQFGFALNGTDVKFDNATGGVNKSGNAEYIPSQTKFQANIIKDSSGSIVGVAFKQL